MKSATERKRQAAETSAHREARLEGLRAAKQQRLATETAEEREARLEGLRAAQQERLAAETAEEREQNDRDGTVNALFRQKC